MQGDSLIFSLFKFIIKFCKIIAIIHCLHLETVYNVRKNYNISM